MVSMHVDWVQSLLLENLGYGAMVCPRNYQQFVIHETVTQFTPYGQDVFTIVLLLKMSFSLRQFKTYFTL